MSEGLDKGRQIEAQPLQDGRATHGSGEWLYSDAGWGGMTQEGSGPQLGVPLDPILLLDKRVARCVFYSFLDQRPLASFTRVLVTMRLETTRNLQLKQKAAAQMLRGGG